MTIATRGQGFLGEPCETQNIPATSTSNEQSNNEGQNEYAEPDFPHEKLLSLDEKISNVRWVVPVLPDQELECLLNASIELAKKGLDTQSEACQRFFREGLTISFTKILTDDAVSSWKANIHSCIFQNCLKLVELCVVKLKQDWFPLLDLLAMLFNPNNKFHTFNASRVSESAGSSSNLSEEELFARPSNDIRNPRGWLVDLINKFGELGGFQLLLERFQSGNLSVSVIFALIRPFGLSYEYLTPHTINKYILPILDIIPKILEKLTDDELKREAKSETKSDIVSAIIKSSKNLASRVPNQEELIRVLESFRLRMILRQLQISSFNGKMNALNEINKVISSVAYYPNRHHGMEEEEYLTSERMAKWLKENQVLEIVLRDSLHQPQYVEKLEKILRFVIKEHALTLSDLDAIWSAQVGKHEAIVKNVHDLLAKLAWDFSPEQLDHLFECFQSSWTSASKRQRERLLELIRRLAEDDKEGVMAHKVLTLFWNLAHSEEVPTEIMDQALAAHVKILDYSCSQERDAQKTVWLDKCVDELKQGDSWALPALKQIREISCLYEPNVNGIHTQRTNHTFYRQEVIERLQTQHSLVILVTNSLTSYMERLRALAKEHPELTAENYVPDGRYNHIAQVQERLNFLRFLLKDGNLWLCADQAKQIWNCLTENAVFPSDREACFRWFSKLMGEEPDLDPGINKDFFENNILQLDPVLLTESGIKCFERFFKAVNVKEEKLKPKRRMLLTEDPDLIGLDYLWRVVTLCNAVVAARAIELLREVTTNLGPSLQATQLEFHEQFVTECFNRLRAYYDTVIALQQSSSSDKDEEVEAKQLVDNRIKSEAVKMCRVLRLLYEYLNECDSTFVGERRILPLYRACRGKHMTLIIRFSSPMRHVDDLEIFTHSNETLASLRRHILRKIKPGVHCKLELFVNGEPLDSSDDWKLLSKIPLRDKMFISAKVSQINSNIASSQDSSSDSSTSSPQHPYDGPNIEAENLLPGVQMSLRTPYAYFFCQLAALGSAIDYPLLRDGARLLLQAMPCDNRTMQKLMLLFEGSKDPEITIENMFFRASPPEVLYNLEVLYVLLMPAQEPLSEKSYEFQNSFIMSGEAHTFLDFLIKNNFMANADIVTMRSAFLIVLKICKLILTSVAHVLVRLSEDHTPPETNEGRNENVTTPGMYLKQALRSVPGHSDSILRQVAMKLCQGLANLMLSETNTGNTQALFNQALNWEFPDTNVVLAILRLVWAASSANLHSRDAGPDTLHSFCNPAKRNAPLELHADDALLCKEALELLSIALVLNPSSLEHLCCEKMFLDFLTDLVLFNPSSAVRISAAEQFLVICTCGAASKLALQLVTPFLFSLLNTLVVENTQTSHELFQLLCRLVNFSYVTHVALPNVEELVSREVAWLRNARNEHDVLLEGHLSLARELLSFMSTEQKCELGSSDKGTFIKELLEDFLFPASKLMLQLSRTGQLGEDPATPICDTPQTQAAAFDLLISLCVTSVMNCKQLVAMLTDMFYSDPESAIVEWDYFPAVGPRPFQGFVGLKNAGATCYMNSVLQQLYMVESIREGVLAAEGAATDPNEDFSGEDRLDIDSDCCCDERAGPDNNRKDYNVGILKQVQAIFGHLAYSRLQYYVPKGLWKHFKLQGEPVNLREQQDAVEFFMSLVESLDESLKTLGHEQIMSKFLGGSYSDQKICKGCPHRYSKEEPFSVISVDIRNHSSLQDSMEQYVKGELLEGADAYYCEKCAKKVVTVKRLCVKKLPPILTIQLKRFEYDFERVCAIKFNDYFEFPRNLDMEPYTVSGLAKLEGEIVDCDLETSTTDACTKYRLSGIVVHSGQASGGHYYSYIRNCDPTGKVRWYKFDDGDVSECRMGEDEEMKIQCFGGDYMGEVFDPMLKRTTYRRQKRWWNAYMLFYTRMGVGEMNFLKSIEMLSVSCKKEKYVKMPLAIENSIRKQNIKFLHHHSQFYIEYFSFIRKLVTCTAPTSSRTNINSEAEQLSLLCTQLASKFLFHSGWHTKKNLRGPAIEWCDILCLHLRASPITRSWFANEMLLSHPQRFSEYLLVCPSNEIRSAFTKIIVLLAHFSNNDGPSPPPTGFDNPDPSATLTDHLFLALLNLLQREVSENGRHLPHYCNVFHMYASQGIHEKTQLLNMNVPATFMLVATDEGPGPAIKYQYIELGKLHQVVSCLVRCCNVSSKCQSSTGNPVLPNPYREVTIPDYIMPLSPQAMEILFGRTGYIKKVIEDTNISEDAIKLLQFCCWENPHFSRIILSELLWQIAFAYCQELRHHMELLLSILLIEDSWQTHRIHNAIKGVPEEREGLLETIARSKNHYQKRAYQCIKCMVALFSKCRPALAMLHGHADLKRQWAQAVAWLQDELERRYPATSQYSYNTWSPPAQSNDNSNGYFLERSNSARKTFERAIELMPEADRGEEENASEEQESQEEVTTETSQGEDNNKSEMPDVTQSCEGNNPSQNNS